jgi:hypothetical protein
MLARQSAASTEQRLRMQRCRCRGPCHTTPPRLALNLLGQVGRRARVPWRRLRPVHALARSATEALRQRRRAEPRHPGRAVKGPRLHSRWQQVRHGPTQAAAIGVRQGAEGRWCAAHSGRPGNQLLARALFHQGAAKARTSKHRPCCGMRPLQPLFLRPRHVHASPAPRLPPPGRASPVLHHHHTLKRHPVYPGVRVQVL